MNEDEYFQDRDPLTPSFDYRRGFERGREWEVARSQILLHMLARAKRCIAADNLWHLEKDIAAAIAEYEAAK